MVDVIDQEEDVLRPTPRSAALVDRRRKELTELATHYQKTKGKSVSAQPKEVLVRQIMGQVEEGRDTITFAIPYNPSFIGPKKMRSEEDGLDIATRTSLDNIYAFANRVAAITDKRVSFILLYDSALSLGICERDIIDPQDYLIGVQAIHRYTSMRNTSRVQIREWDTVADSMLGSPQGVEFVGSSKLESDYAARLGKLEEVFGEKGRTSLRTFVAGQIEAMHVEAHPAEIEQTYEWIKGTFNRDSMEEAQRIALSIELFKRIDARENGHRIIRLSPHVKDEKEHSKYGFSFFPGSGIMMEPWVGNFVAKSSGGFNLDIHRKERSFEEVAELERLAEEAAKRREANIKKQQRKGGEKQRGEERKTREVLGAFTQDVVSGSPSAVVDTLSVASSSSSSVVDTEGLKPAEREVSRTDAV